jgi:hypothetical protein
MFDPQGYGTGKSFTRKRKNTPSWEQGGTIPERFCAPISKIVSRKTEIVRAVANCVVKMILEGDWGTVVTISF